MKRIISNKAISIDDLLAVTGGMEDGPISASTDDGRLKVTVEAQCGQADANADATGDELAITETTTTVFEDKGSEATGSAENEDQILTLTDKQPGEECPPADPAAA